MGANRLKTAVLLAAVLAVAGALRFWAIGEKSLWLDETYTELRTRGSFAESMEEATAYDAPPPLYLALMWFWRRAAGDSDAALRAFSASCDLATVLLLFFLLKRLVGKEGAIAGAILYAVSAFAIYFAQEARHYALFNMLATASTLVFAGILSPSENALTRISHQDAPGGGQTPRRSPASGLREGSDPPDSPTRAASRTTSVFHARGEKCGLIARRFLYALLLALTFYTFQYGLFVLAAHLVCLVLLRIFKPEIVRKEAQYVFAMMLLAVAAYALYLPQIFSRAEELSAAGVESRGFELLNIPRTVASEMCGPEGLAPFGGFTLAGAALAAAVIAGVAAGGEKAKRGIFFGALLLVPFACLAALPFRPHIFEAKHVIFLCPILFGGAAAFFAGSRTGGLGIARLLAGVVLACALLVANVMALARYYSPRTEKEAWREAAESVCGDLEAGDAVVFAPYQAVFPFERYLPPGTKRIMAASPAVSAQYEIARGAEIIDVPVIILLKGVVAGTGNPVYRSGGELAYSLKDAKRVWVITLASNVSRVTPAEREALDALERNFEQIRLPDAVKGDLRGLVGEIDIRIYERRQAGSSAPNNVSARP